MKKYICIGPILSIHYQDNFWLLLYTKLIEICKQNLNEKYKGITVCNLVQTFLNTDDVVSFILFHTFVCIRKKLNLGSTQNIILHQPVLKSQHQQHGTT